MRRTKWVGGVVVALGAAVGVTTAQDAGEYDLRGPGPVKGQVILTTSSFKIKNAKVSIKIGGQGIDARQTMTATDEEEVKFLAVEGRQVTRVQTRIIKEELHTVTTVGGQDQEETKPGELHGEIVVGTRGKNGKWKHALVDTEPDEKQKKELAKRVGPENDDDVYPAGKVKVGRTWTVDAAALQRVFGGSISDLKGKMSMTLLRVEDYNGEACAVIESKGKVTGVAKEDEGDLDVTIDLTGLTWRSLKTGIDVKDQAKGRMRMSGKVDMDGAKVDLTLDGPITLDGTARLKK